MPQIRLPGILAWVLVVVFCRSGVSGAGFGWWATAPAWRSGRAEVDIAVFRVPDLPALPVLSCTRVNTGIAARIENCVALGFPKWNDRNDAKRRAQADGYVATGEGADPHAAVGTPELLTFKITTPAIRDKPVVAGDLDRESTPWGGMSGAVVVTGDGQIVGWCVVTRPRRGWGR